MKGKYLANDSLNPDSSAFFFLQIHIYPYPMKLVLAKRSNRLQAFDALGAGASELPSCLWNVSLWKGSCPERSESVRIPQFSQFFRLVQRNDGGELRHWLLDPPNSFAEWPFLSRTNVAQTRFPTSQTVRTIAYYGQVASTKRTKLPTKDLLKAQSFCRYASHASRWQYKPWQDLKKARPCKRSYSLQESECCLPLSCLSFGKDLSNGFRWKNLWLKSVERMVLSPCLKISCKLPHHPFLEVWVKIILPSNPVTVWKHGWNPIWRMPSKNYLLYFQSGWCHYHSWYGSCGFDTYLFEQRRSCACEKWSWQCGPDRHIAAAQHLQQLWILKSLIVCKFWPITNAKSLLSILGWISLASWLNSSALFITFLMASSNTWHIWHCVPLDSGDMTWPAIDRHGPWPRGHTSRAASAVVSRSARSQSSRCWTKKGRNLQWSQCIRHSTPMAPMGPGLDGLDGLDPHSRAPMELWWPSRARRPVLLGPMRINNFEVE